MVAGFEIDGELVSTTRYRASLTVDFDPTEVRRLLRDSGIAYAETVSKPVLVVAVQRDPRRHEAVGGRKPLAPGVGGAPAPRRPGADPPAARRHHRSRHGGRRAGAGVRYGGAGRAGRALRHERGGGRGRRAFGLRCRRQALRARRRGGGGSWTARPRPPAARSRSRCAGSRPTETGPVQKTLIGRADESERALLERGTDRIVTLLEDAWKAANLIRYGEDHALQATVPITSLGEWVSIQQRLAALAMVAAVEIDSLSVREARLTLRYHGTADQLRLALDQNDLALEPLADEWVLAPRAAQPEPEAPDEPAPEESVPRGRPGRLQADLSPHFSPGSVAPRRSIRQERAEKRIREYG